MSGIPQHRRECYRRALALDIALRELKRASESEATDSGNREAISDAEHYLSLLSRCLDDVLAPGEPDRSEDA